MHWLKNITLLVGCTLYCVGVSAQYYSPFKNIDGAVSDVIHCIYQDSKGFIWVGTELGVSRYDGYGFKHFTRDDGLSDNEVFQIHEDRKGRLWFLTYNGQPTIYDNGKIHTPANTNFLSDVKPGVISRSIVERGDSILYTTASGVYLFLNDSLVMVNDESTSDYTPSPIVESHIYDWPVSYISTSMLHMVNSNADLRIKRNILGKSSIKILVARGKIYNFSGEKIFAYNLSDKTIDTIKIDNCKSITRIYYDNTHDYFWVLAENAVYKYLPDVNEVKKITDHSIPFAVYMHVDKNNNIWISSLKSGLYFSKISGVYTFDLMTSLNTRNTHCIYRYQSSIYAGLINNEYFVWSGGNAKMFKKGSGNDLDKIYEFANVDDKLYAISGKGVFPVNDSGDYLFKIQHSTKCMTAGKKYIYLGMSFGIDKIPNRQNYYLRNAKEVPGRIRIYNKRVNSIFVLNDDSVYMGTIEGMKLLINDTLSGYVNDGEEILKRNISKVTSNRYGHIFFASTAKGIGIIDGSELYVIDRRKGLSSNECNNVFVENDSTLWVATNFGLNKVIYALNTDSVACRVKKFTTANGLPSNSINDVTVYHDTVWLATTNGVCFFREKEMDVQSTIPTVLIENFWIDKKNVPFSSPVKMPHNENNISIDFVALSYNLQNSIAYRYKLSGVDKDWKYTTATHVEYPGLPDGKYHFMVTATNSNGPWSDEVKTISFTILPPFWKTAWFIVLLVIACLLLIYLGVRIRINSIKRKHALENKDLQMQKEKAEFERELSQLEQKAMSLQINPHFIFNAINTIKGFYADNNRSAADEYIDKFASLMRMILEKNSLTTLSLQEEVDILEAYLELAAIRQGNKFTYEINIDEEINTRLIRIPPMLLQPMVENAVIHGMGPLQTNGKILLSFRKENGTLVCAIEDNGPGVSQSKKKSKYKIHNSKGIDITRKRLLHLSSESKMTIEDSKDNSGTIQGTIVIIKLPLIQKNNDT